MYCISYFITAGVPLYDWCLLHAVYLNQILESQGIYSSKFPGLESHVIRLGAGKSFKVMENKPNGCRISDPSTCFRPSHTLSLSTARLGLICCLVYLVHVYEI